MKEIPISTVRHLGQSVGARRVVVIYADGDIYGMTSWGKTRAECAALGEWLDSDEGKATAIEVMTRRP